jgi:hypothetical protein
VIIKGMDLPQLLAAIQTGEFDLTAEELIASLADRLEQIP